MFVTAAHSPTVATCRALARARVALCALVAGIACVGYAQPAHAQPATLPTSPAITRDPAAADVLFEKGKNAAAAGNFTAACPLFYESQRLDPGAGTLLNIADCEERQGHTATALGRFQEARDLLQATDERRGFADKQVRALQARVPKVTMRVRPGLTTEFEVQRDAVVLSHAVVGVALPVDPGTHRYIVRARGHADRSFELTLKDGDTKELVIELGAATQDPPKPTGDTKLATDSRVSAIANGPGQGPSTTPGGAPASPYLPLGIGLGAGGVLALGTGVVTGVMTLSAGSTYKAECPTQLACTAEGRSAQSRGKTLSVVSPIAFGTGLLALGASAYFLFFAAPPRASASALRVAPLFGAGGQGVLLSGQF
jgi:hypothetical protein